MAKEVGVAPATVDMMTVGMAETVEVAPLSWPVAWMRGGTGGMWRVGRARGGLGTCEEAGGRERCWGTEEVGSKGTWIMLRVGRWERVQWIKVFTRRKGHTCS